MSALSDSASRIFSSEFAALSAVVLRRLEIEWRCHRRKDLTQADRQLLRYAEEFGRLLKVVYRHRLLASLGEEAEWYASVFAARGSGHDSFGLVLDSWIIAIQGVIRPPECNELARPIRSIRDVLQSLISRGRVRSAVPGGGADPRLMGHLMRGDARGAREFISAMAREGSSPERLIVDTMIPAMKEIGRRWEANEIEVFHEHLASETMRVLLAWLSAMAPLPRAARVPTALVSCAPDDAHELIPSALCAYLETRGWESRNLGVSLPAGQIARAVAAFNPDALFLTFTMLSRLDDVLEVIEQVRLASGSCRIIVGGRGSAAAGAILWGAGALVARDFGEGFRLASGGPGNA